MVSGSTRATSRTTSSRRPRSHASSAARRSRAERRAGSASSSAARSSAGTDPAVAPIAAVRSASSSSASERPRSVSDRRRGAVPQRAVEVVGHRFPQRGMDRQSLRGPCRLINGCRHQRVRELHPIVLERDEPGLDRGLHLAPAQRVGCRHDLACAWPTGRPPRPAGACACRRRSAGYDPRRRGSAERSAARSCRDASASVGSSVALSGLPAAWVKSRSRAIGPGLGPAGRAARARRDHRAARCAVRATRHGAGCRRHRPRGAQTPA